MRRLIRRAAGWIGADRNPRRRPVDMCGSRLPRVFLLGFLVSAPLIAPAAGHLTHAAGLRQVRQEASWQQVNAVLLQPAPPAYYGYRSVATYWVAGRWRAPSG